MVEFISILVLTFTLAMVVLGIITVWLERERRRLLGVVMSLVGLLVGAGYAFLGSRFSEALFGRLIVAVDWPNLLTRFFTYMAGGLIGCGMAIGLFLWATGRFRHQFGRTTVALAVAGVVVALVATILAIVLSAY